jgi:hypothetical protein
VHRPKNQPREYIEQKGAKGTEVKRDRDKTRTYAIASPMAPVRSFDDNLRQSAFAFLCVLSDLLFTPFEVSEKNSLLVDFAARHSTKKGREVCGSGLTDRPDR